nr:MAG TPA: hypothetical protein [Caudoviricetes sp.]
MFHRFASVVSLFGIGRGRGLMFLRAVALACLWCC